VLALALRVSALPVSDRGMRGDAGKLTMDARVLAGGCTGLGYTSAVFNAGKCTVASHERTVGNSMTCTDNYTKNLTVGPYQWWPRSVYSPLTARHL
jgi:hypothetical protein